MAQEATILPANLEPVFERLTELVPSILYVFDLREMSNVWANQSLFNYLGYREEDVQQMGASILPKLMHPEDFVRYQTHYENLLSLKDGEQAEFEYRMKHADGHWVWLHSNEAVNLRNENGDVVQIVGSAHDITSQKEALAQVELVSSELRHRVGNIFAVISSMISITATSKPEAKEVLGELSARIHAMSHAHEVTLNSGQPDNIDIKDLLRRSLDPFRGGAPIEVNVGQGVQLPAYSTGPIGMILHELATNAVKHGALRDTQGRVDVTLDQADGGATLQWVETFGASMSIDPEQTRHLGFGSRLIDLSVRQLSGTFESEFHAGGMQVRVVFPAKIFE